MSRQKLFLKSRNSSLGIMLTLVAGFSLSACTNKVTPGTANELMIQVIEQYNDTIMQTPYSTPASYMEKASCDGEYCMYTEAIGYLYSFGYDYEIQPGNFVLLPTNMKKSDRKSSWIETLKYWYADAPHVKHQTDLRPGYNTLFTTFRWFEINGPFGDPNSFTYEILDTLEAKQPDPSLIQVVFRPSGRNEHYSGTFYIDGETLAIHRVQLDQILHYSDNFRKRLLAEGEITWHTENNFTSVSSVKLNFKNESLEYWIQLHTSPSLTNYTEIKERELLALAYNNTNPFVLYQPDKWPTAFPFPEINMDPVRCDMEAGRTLEEQFEVNSNQSFLTKIDQDGREFTVTGGEETYSIVNQILVRLEQEFKNGG